jgi:phosphoglycolate phosphatase-like HAD superfamily hydrolase
MAKIFLFDVDNTLLNSGGAGARAMNLAFRDLFGVENGFAGVEFTGRTDIAIVRDALRLHRLDDGDFPGLLARFKVSYLRHLARTLPQTAGHLMPGVPDLLRALRESEGVRVGLATGNLRRGAMMKLEHYGIRPFFQSGGFGDDSERRSEVVALAIRRLGGRPGGRNPVFVVGDTPLDVEAAKANRAVAVGVATGTSGVEDLARAGADVVFPDFSDLASVLGVLLS